jgi:hypothetical protein
MMGDNPRQQQIRQLKTDFDRWFDSYRKLIPDAYSVEEEEHLIDGLKTGRTLQGNLIDATTELDLSC